VGHCVREDMLEHLFGSRTRVKLLSLFLRSPEEPIFVREITRRVGTQINAVRRELSNLHKLGLIIEVEEKLDGPKKSRAPGLKKKFYKVNPEFRLFNELSALLLRAQALYEGRLDQEIPKLGDVRYLAFLGVFLGQKAPVDVFIVGTINENAMKRLINEAEKSLGYEINYSVMSFEDYRYRKDMTDKFLYAILEGQKHVVLDKLAERAPVA